MTKYNPQEIEAKWPSFAPPGFGRAGRIMRKYNPKEIEPRWPSFALRQAQSYGEQVKKI
jgi:hypothetical protein